MSDAPKPHPEPHPFDKTLGPDWRERAAECGAFWRKTFQTTTERILQSERADAYARHCGRGNRPW